MCLSEYAICGGPERPEEDVRTKVETQVVVSCPVCQEPSSDPPEESLLNTDLNSL